MSEKRRTHSPQRIEALNELLNLTSQAITENEAEKILDLPDPWTREVMLLSYIGGAVEYIKHLQRQVATNQPQPYIHDASGGGFPIGNPDLLYGSPGVD